MELAGKVDKLQKDLEQLKSDPSTAAKTKDLEQDLSSLKDTVKRMENGSKPEWWAVAIPWGCLLVVGVTFAVVWCKVNSREQKQKLAEQDINQRKQVLKLTVRAIKWGEQALKLKENAQEMEMQVLTWQRAPNKDILTLLEESRGWQDEQVKDIVKGVLALIDKTGKVLDQDARIGNEGTPPPLNTAPSSDDPKRP